MILLRTFCRAITWTGKPAVPAPDRPVDRVQGGHYIVPKIAVPCVDLSRTTPQKRIMPEPKPETLDLVALESRVDDLIRTVDQLKTENSALRSQQDNLIGERATLIEKTEQARSRIESMITRLRAMETRS